MSKPNEGPIDIVCSFFIEIVFTTILCIFIFWNFKAPDTNGGGKYRKALAINGSDYFTYGPIITGIVLMILIFSAVGIIYAGAVGWSPTGSPIASGHMFPLITIPAMLPNGLGIVNISVLKGLAMLIAQFMAMFIAWALIFYTDM
jgi:hypothetical protein